jgi:excisionase family DNA binding protein
LIAFIRQKSITTGKYVQSKATERKGERVAAITTTERKGEKEAAATATAAANSPYLKYPEAAAFCRVERTTLYRAVKAGSLRAVGPGTAVRFDRDELRRWMDSRNRT